MPRASLTTCSIPGCPNLVVTGRCPEHTRQLDREIKARQPHRDYGSRWQKLRLRVLREEPACRDCGAPAVDVDHIVPLAEGGRTQRPNLQALCRRCHNLKTTRQTRRGGDPSSR